MLGTPGGVPIQQVEFRIVNLPTLLSSVSEQNRSHLQIDCDRAPLGASEASAFRPPWHFNCKLRSRGSSSVRQEYGTSPFGEFKPDTLQPQATSMLGLPSGRGGDWSISTNAAKVIPIHMIPSQGLVWVTGCRADGGRGWTVSLPLRKVDALRGSRGSSTPTTGPTRAVAGMEGCANCRN